MKKAFGRACAAWVVSSVALGAWLALPRSAAAQSLGQNLRGDAGLKSATQAAPGAYVVAPVWAQSADQLRGADGEVLATGQLNAAVFGVGLSYVTNQKVAGANYGFLVTAPWSSNRLQTNQIDQDAGTGFTDMYVQPVNLGWHAKRADFLLAYGLYLPTGSFEVGASDNHGLGMWGHELVAGATVYLDAGRQWHAATTASFNFFSEKKGTDRRVGNILTLEGGLGRDFRGGTLTAGAAYYAGYKLTADDLGAAAGGLVLPKDRGYGVGPELTVALKTSKAIYGSVTVRYLFGMGTRVGVEGNTLSVLAAFMLKPVKLPPPQ